MSFTTAITRVSANGDGVSVSFTVPWLFYANTDLLVIMGGVTQALGVQFNAAGAGVGSGTVTFVSAPPVGVGNVQIILNDPLTQTANFVDGTAFPSNTLNQVNDRAVQISSRLYDLITRSLRAPDGDSSPNMLLPSAAQRSNGGLGGLIQGYDSNGNPALLTTLPVGASLSAAIIGNFITPPSAGEIAVGVTVVNGWYPVGNVLRYGIVPNNASSAAANTVALRQLVAYGIHQTGWTGVLTFANTTGSDIYYFNNYLDFRPGIEVDLQWSTLSFNKVADITDANSGFISAIRDFSIKNGYINVTSTCTNGMHALMFGARGADGVYFVPMYDAAYYAATGQTMGNIRVNNIKVNSLNPSPTNPAMIFMFGGLQNVSFENVWMEGNGVADGVYYEFGWATDNGGVLAGRQTSHAHNLSFKNIKATNLQTSAAGGAIVCNGAYNVNVDGLYVSIGSACFGFGTGESWFYNAWAGMDDGQVSRRTATLRNIVGKGITGAGITIQGSGTASTIGPSYLQATINALPTPQRWVAITDRTSAIIDGFYMNGSANNYGIALIGPSRIDISNGHMAGFLRGINATVETTQYHIRNVTILDSVGIGIQMGAGFPVWIPDRQSLGVIEDCFIAGSGTGGTSAAIAIGDSYSCHIRNNRIGYEIAHDGVAETTQAQAVTLGATAFGVVCDNNYVAGTSGGAVAYNLAASGNSRGCAIVNPRGVATITGLWGSVQTVGNFGLTYGASMTPDASSTRNIITATNNTAFTINAPSNPPTTLGAKLTVIIRNTSGGALGVATFAATYKLAAWTQPATANSRSITFDWDGTNWVESSRTPADVPN